MTLNQPDIFDIMHHKKISKWKCIQKWTFF